MTIGLRVRDMRVAYGARAVLRGVGIDVRGGEVVGLVGPNGCGKTTLLRAVTRVIPRQSGEVTVGGVAEASLSRSQLARHIAVVPQSPELPAGFSVLDVVLMGRTPHLGFLEQEGAEDYRIARECLARVAATDLTDRRIDELSGGERQNVVLARALAQQTPVILLDEPTAHLDIGHQIAVARLMRELAHTSGLAVLAAIHDLTLAALYCDRLVLMAAGEVIAEGAPGDVLTEENITRAYGARTMVLHHPSLPAPIVAPYSGIAETAAAREDASSSLS